MKRSRRCSSASHLVAARRLQAAGPGSSSFRQRPELMPGPLRRAAESATGPLLRARQQADTPHRPTAHEVAEHRCQGSAGGNVVTVLAPACTRSRRDRTRCRAAAARHRAADDRRERRALHAPKADGVWLKPRESYRVLIMIRTYHRDTQGGGAAHSCVCQDRPCARSTPSASSSSWLMTRGGYLVQGRIRIHIPLI